MLQSFRWTAAALCVLAAATSGAAQSPDYASMVMTVTLSSEEAQMSAQGLCDDQPGFDENPPAPLPQKATAEDLKWQPAMDFDKDSCYNVAAIGPDGHIDLGRSRHEQNSADCRDESDLDNGNVYSRNRCNSNGWCAYVYDYFFEKDIGDRICIGHKFDWEHIVVWTKDGVPQVGAVSAHGKYDLRKWADVPKEGTHLRAVYNKDGAIGTHYMRFSHGERDNPPENHKGVWWRSSLVSWNGFPTTQLRDKLAAYDFGSAHMALTDGSLPGNLKRASDGFPVSGFSFDYDADYNSPGVP